MNKKLAIVSLLLVLLLTGCADNQKTSLNNVSDNAFQTKETSKEVNASTEELATETEDNSVLISPYPSLMYNGTIYVYLVYSAQTELDGRYCEVDGGEDAFVDAERMRNECDYIGESIPNPDNYARPDQELEVTCSDEVYELYKIDENQVLLYSTRDLDIPESWQSIAAVYPGTFRRHYILIRNDKYDELSGDLQAQYYRLNERFPNTKSESRTSAVTEEAKPETSSLFTNYVLDGAENLSINGEVLDSAELAEFEYDVLRLEDYKPELSKFLSVSGLTEIAEQCARGYTLLRFFSTENLSSGILDEQSLETLSQLNIAARSPNRFYASGISYDSFINSYLDVFTVDAAERVFSRFPNFCSYKEQLWFADCAMTGNVGDVHEEYELITNSDSEILLRCTVYSVEVGEPPEYDPDKRDSYETYMLDYKFVKTADGWRADEFPIYSRDLDGVFPEQG